MRPDETWVNYYGVIMWLIVISGNGKHEDHDVYLAVKKSWSDTLSK